MQLNELIQNTLHDSPDYVRIIVGGPIASGKTTVSHAIASFISGIKDVKQPFTVFDFDVEKTKSSTAEVTYKFESALASAKGLIIPNCSLKPSVIKEQCPLVTPHCLMILPQDLFDVSQTIRSLIIAPDLPDTLHKKGVTMLKHAHSVAYHALQRPGKELLLSRRLSSFSKLVIYNYVQHTHSLLKTSENATLKRYDEQKDNDIFTQNFDSKDALSDPEAPTLPGEMRDVLQKKVLTTLKNLGDLLLDKTTTCHFVPYKSENVLENVVQTL